MMDIGMMGWRAEFTPLGDSISQIVECSTYSWKNRLQTGTAVEKCRFVRVIITLYTYYYYYLYCSDGGDGGGIRARTLLSIAVWPAGSAGGSLASFFVIAAITIEIEM